MSTTHLQDRLREAPIDDEFLLRVYWGEVEGKPVILEKLAQDLVSFSRSTHILVYGRYGVGKTSFLFSLQKYIRKCAERDDSDLLYLWLHMPIITSNTGSSPAAAIIGAIVQNLCSQPTIVSPGMEPLKKLAGTRVRNNQSMLTAALAELWARHADDTASSTSSSREQPREHRMSGTVASPKEVYQANTIEQLIESSLGWTDSTEGARMVVFLDDVDRCSREVPPGIINLLLRFRSNRAVRFVIACDRDVMESGVSEWMRENGTVRDGQLLVTANSALEKYLDHVVRLPGLSERPMLVGEAPPISLRQELVDLLSRPLGDADPDPILAPVARVTETDDSPSLADYLLTWFLEHIDEDVLLRRTGSVGGAQPQPPPCDDDATPPLGEDLPKESELAPEEHSDEPESVAADRANDVIRPDKSTSLVDHAKVLADAPDLTRIIPKVLSPFAVSLRSFASLDAARRLLRILPRYQDLFESLTPRQLKYYLRARLYGTTRDEDDGPEGTLLSQVFHPFWLLSKEEPFLFEFATAAATAAKRAARRARYAAGERSRSLGLGSGVRPVFEQFLTLCKSSTVLTEERLRESWPAKHEERVLLINLLDALNHGGSSGRDGTPPPPPPDDFIGGRDTRFDEWVQSQLNRRPEGPTVSEQVSSFQDFVLEDHRAGKQGMTSLAAEYVDRFLDSHAPYLGVSAATSLSNLAVLIDDIEPFERHCDRMFAEAVRLNPAESRIQLYYAEFLLDALGAAPRFDRLIAEGRYDSAADLLQRIDTLLKTARPRDPIHEFYLKNLQLRWNVAQDPSRTIGVEQLKHLIEDSIPLFVQSAEHHDAQIASRLDDTIDAIVGQTTLQARARLMGVPWGVLAARGKPTWTIAFHVANSYVGHSEAASHAERLGLQMNMSLLRDPDLLQHGSGRVSAIWTQTLSVWSRGRQPAPPEAQSRAALGMVAALVYGGDSQWMSRATRIWNRIGGHGSPDPRNLVQYLTEEQQAVLAALQQDPLDSNSVVQAVFQQEYDPPIRTVTELAVAEQWDDWSDVESVIARLAATAD